MTARKVCIVVSGPRRDYDYSSFCCDHSREAEQCAAEWAAEIVDGLDVGESGAVTIEVCAWVEAESVCVECDRSERRDGN